MDLQHSFHRYWMIAAVVLAIALTGCRINGQRLRGNTVLGLRLPIMQASQQDGMSISSDHMASRSFLPVSVHTPINRVRVPDPLWADLEQLRRSWCQQRPLSPRLDLMI